MVEILHGDNLPFLRAMEAGRFALVYIDPPFNTGRTQTRTRTHMHRDEAGDRIGFGEQRYRTEVLGRLSFRDTFDDYLAFLEPRLREAR